MVSFVLYPLCAAFLQCRSDVETAVSKVDTQIDLHQAKLQREVRVWLHAHAHAHAHVGDGVVASKIFSGIPR